MGRGANTELRPQQGRECHRLASLALEELVSDLSRGEEIPTTRVALAKAMEWRILIQRSVSVRDVLSVFDRHLEGVLDCLHFADYESLDPAIQLNVLQRTTDLLGQ
jgi:hypothetical protein